MSARSPARLGIVPWKVLLDFDGTLVQPNVAIVLMGKFVPDGDRLAKEIDLALQQGRMSLREAWAQELALLPLDRAEEMAEHVRRNVPLRPGAEGLIGWLKDHRVPWAVVSGGLDFYIRAVLEREGMEAPVYADSFAPAEGGKGPFRPLHPYGHPTCTLCGICKAQLVRASGTGGEKVFFVGDGTTDRYAAEVADLVFARHRLKAFCEREGVPHVPFEEFHTVEEHLDDWWEGRVRPPFRASRGLRGSPCPISRALVG